MKFIEAGGFYRDPTVPANQPTYRYCTVAVDRELPDGVAYEL